MLGETMGNSLEEITPLLGAVAEAEFRNSGTGAVVSSCGLGRKQQHVCHGKVIHCSLPVCAWDVLRIVCVENLGGNLMTSASSQAPYFYLLRPLAARRPSG